jgi:hypothetical protein
MSDRERHIGQLFTAELQFRLASTVRLAVTLEVQPLDLPIEWTHGQHKVRYEEIALRPDQANYAADFLQRTTTYLMAVAINDAIVFAVPAAEQSEDPDVRGAFQIARLIRNAFAHGPVSPTWLVPKKLRKAKFEVGGIIALDATGIHGSAFDWRHYGGPLALFRLSQFTRIKVLGDDRPPRKLVPLPSKHIQQIGDLILQKVDEIPPTAKEVTERLPDGGIDLGDGYVIRPRKDK